MILSVSRRTDIPAFYSEWFFTRIKEGYVYTRNPINKNAVSKISLNPQVIDCIVFWTKNPSLIFMENLGLIASYKYYFQFTINPYNDSIEQNVPKKQIVINNFIKLSEKIGKEKVIWRYDPILLSKECTLQYHVQYFEELAKRLHQHTEKCIISFIDYYKKCEQNLKEANVRTLENSEVIELSKNLKDISDFYGLRLETCAEEYELDSIGIFHGRCIDNDLIERITGEKIEAKKDKNQRSLCGCIESIDIGEYNTCKHNCLYCYANYSRGRVLDNSKMHITSSPLLLGEIKNTDIVKEREMYSLFKKTLFD
ncbi:MAG TPA: DUF1848 domain-containing protein [Bacteroidales bacterium]|nr:DUF1848 domain-containing protein [Bacteroidales bacterium]HPT20718.1 DUF1848 domain-containing protein [Bacteroidales bacterium]